MQQVLRSLFVDLLIQKTLKVKSSVTKRDNAYSVPRLAMFALLMKKIIDYLFYRYYLVCLKNEEFPRFGAACILSEVISITYMFASFLFSFFLTGHFFFSYMSKLTTLIIWIIGFILPWIGVYIYYNKKRTLVLFEKFQDNIYNAKYSDKAVLSIRYIILIVGLLLMLFLYQF